MKRRDVIIVLGGAAVSWPLAARAQQLDQPRLVAVFTPFGFDQASEKQSLLVLKQALQKLGWSEGRNVRIEHRGLAEDNEQAKGLARELVGLAPAVILTTSTAALRVMQQETRTIPIVFIAVVDPVGEGFVASLARPGGNATGFSTFETPMGSKWVELLKELAPRTVLAAVVFNPDSTVPSVVRSVQSRAASLGMQLTMAQVHDQAGIEHAMEAIAGATDAGVIVPPDSFMVRHTRLIVGLAERYRLPGVYPFRNFAVLGGLVSYGVNLGTLWARGASYIDRILKGARPADLPVQQHTIFELVINLKTAKSIGLTVPAALLARADEVIE
jgi:putative tryptophan/tyrosine transport system substrate-binding protein